MYGAGMVVLVSLPILICKIGDSSSKRRFSLDELSKEVGI